MFLLRKDKHTCRLHPKPGKHQEFGMLAAHPKRGRDSLVRLMTEREEAERILWQGSQLNKLKEV